MATVGIRELRQRASELLRRVEAGETIEVTDRGRPVALLGPLPNVSALEQLRATGRLAAAAGGDLPEPVEAESGIPPASEALRALRSDER